MTFYKDVDNLMKNDEKKAAIWLLVSVYKIFLFALGILSVCCVLQLAFIAPFAHCPVYGFWI